jgi:hypothetical protein
MVKRLWEQLHDPAKHFALPSGTDPDSDVAKLFAADADSIDKVVHQIAADPQHGFFNADGTSVQINLDDHLSILPDGQIHIANSTYNYDIPVHAPEGAPVTPEYHPESPDVSPTDGPIVPAPEPTPTPHLDSSAVSGVEAPVSTPVEGSTSSAEAHTSAAVGTHHLESGIIQQHVEGGNTVSEFVVKDKNLENLKFKITTNGSGQTKISYEGHVKMLQINDRLTENWQDEVRKHFNDSAGYLNGKRGLEQSVQDLEIRERALKYLIDHKQGNSGEANILRDSIKNTIKKTEELYGHVFKDNVETFGGIQTNNFGVTVPTGEPHIYADAGAKHLFAYGGSTKERLAVIQEYLNKNPDKSILAADDLGEHRIAWRIGAEGKVEPFPQPIESEGLLKIFNPFAKAPGPEEFEKLIT